VAGGHGRAPDKAAPATKNVAGAVLRQTEQS
jgi:hypothetical protein